MNDVRHAGIGPNHIAIFNVKDLELRESNGYTVVSHSYGCYALPENSLYEVVGRLDDLSAEQCAEVVPQKAVMRNELTGQVWYADSRRMLKERLTEAEDANPVILKLVEKKNVE